MNNLLELTKKYIKLINDKKNNKILKEKIINTFTSDIELLISNKININKQDNDGITPLMYALINRNLDIVKLLIEKGVDVNVKHNRWTPFLYASCVGYFDIVEILIEKGVDINEQDNNGWTALIHVSESGDSDIVKFLIEKGADIDIKDNDGMTALMYASESGFDDIVELLNQ